jgi:diaminopimelate epimerase
MNIRFTKMHGLGNDFMVIDGVNQDIHLNAEQVTLLSDRTRGVGFDQCLLIEPSNSSAVDFNYRIFNANGQEVGQCGNGARCLALFAQHYGLTNKNKLRVATKTTQMDLEIIDNFTVKVDMGVPNLIPEHIPFLVSQQALKYPLELPNQTLFVHAISLGNPHAVTVVEDILDATIEKLGPLISHHASFPEQTNAGFMQLVNKNHILLRVYERGCGETQACGSGAVAAAAIAHLYYELDSEIKVSLPGGDLIIEWPNVSESIFLTGPATFVYEGHLI